MDYAAAGRSRRKVVLLVFLGLLAGAGVALYLKRDDLRWRYRVWESEREVRAWIRTAPDRPVPPGTLLYTDRAEDKQSFVAAGGRWQAGQPLDPSSYGFQVETYPQLRTVGGGGPLEVYLMDGNMVYVGRHTPWKTGGTTEPVTVTVGYLRRQRAGPDFSLEAWADRPPTPPDRTGSGVKFDYHNGGATVHQDLDQFDGLRLYAGRPDPDDPSRFTLPFESYHGKGRFEFDTDAGARDTNDFAGGPQIAVHWDERTPPPATRPGP